MEFFICILPIKCIISSGSRTSIQERFVGVGWGSSRSMPFTTQIFVYLECLGIREWRLIEMLELLKCPMSTMRLFFKWEATNSTQFHLRPRIHKISTPEEASRIPGVLQYRRNTTWKRFIALKKSHYFKESDHWLHI